MFKKDDLIKKIISIAAALLVWQLLSLLVHERILIVGPLEVFIRLFTIWQVEGFWQSILFTFSHIVLGFLLGLILGILFAAIAYKHPVFETILFPWMAVIKSVPVASFVVICLIWLSARNLSVFISFLIVVPLVYQNTLTSLKNIDTVLIDLGKLEDIKYFKKLRTILLPQISAQLISTAGVTASMAWKAGVAAEIIGTPEGSIGKQLYLAKIFIDTDDLLAWTIIIVLLSVGFEKLFVWLLKKILGE